MTVSIKTHLLLLLILCISPINARDAEMRVYLKNTGNEQINVAYAFHPYRGKFHTPSGFGKQKVSGWHTLAPGQSRYFVTIDEWDQATFVFSKRDGFIVYTPKNNRGNYGVPKLDVNPTKNFSYVGSAPADCNVSIRKSFGVKMGGLGDGRANFTLLVPSMTTDPVTPFKKTKPQPSSLGHKQDYLVEGTKTNAVYKYYRLLLSNNKSVRGLAPLLLSREARKNPKKSNFDYAATPLRKGKKLEFKVINTTTARKPGKVLPLYGQYTISWKRADIPAKVFYTNVIQEDGLWKVNSVTSVGIPRF